MPAGLDNIVIPSEEAQEQAFKVASSGGGGVETTGRKWKTGELEFEALMRTLDNSVSVKELLTAINIFIARD